MTVSSDKCKLVAKERLAIYLLSIFTHPAVWPTSPRRAGKTSWTWDSSHFVCRILITWAIVMQIAQPASSFGSQIPLLPLLIPSRSVKPIMENLEVK